MNAPNKSLKSTQPGAIRSSSLGHFALASMKSKSLSISLLVLLVAACDRVKLPEGKRSAPYITVLEQGLTDQFDNHRFPRGEIQIMSELSSQIETGDPKQMKFQASYLQELQKAEKAGFV